MSAIRETCACGAELEVTDRNSSIYSGLTDRATEFRAAHAVCRERGTSPVGDPPPAKPFEWMNPPLWHAHSDTVNALAVLTQMGCPLPCVGVVNDTGWHLECERKAREALAILRGRDLSQPEPSAASDVAEKSNIPSAQTEAAHDDR